MATPSQIARHRSELASRGMVRVTMGPAIASLPQTFEIDARALEVAGRIVDEQFRFMMSGLYESEGATGGPRWAPLSPSYLKQKARKWGGIKGQRDRLLSDAKLLPRAYMSGAFRPMLGEFKILQLTRRLRMSLTSRNGDHVLEAGRGANGPHIVLGTKVPYAAAHWQGGTKLPRRNPIQRTPEQDRHLCRTTIDALIEIIRAKIRALPGAA